MRVCTFCWERREEKLQGRKKKKKCKWAHLVLSVGGGFNWLIVDVYLIGCGLVIQDAICQAVLLWHLIGISLPSPIHFPSFCYSAVLCSWRAWLYVYLCVWWGLKVICMPVVEGEVSDVNTSGFKKCQGEQHCTKYYLIRWNDFQVFFSGYMSFSPFGIHPCALGWCFSK